jgi:hypothetical protein
MKAVIDRIDGTLAVLVVPDAQELRLNVPLALMPEGCNEGDIITFTLERDDESTREAHDRAARLIDTLIHT